MLLYIAEFNCVTVLRHSSQQQGENDGDLAKKSARRVDPKESSSDEHPGTTPDAAVPGKEQRDPR